jgi:hypothetical protein
MDRFFQKRINQWLPNAASFPSAKAIENADSWGFCGAHVNGELTKGKIATVLQEP